MVFLGSRNCQRDAPERMKVVGIVTVFQDSFPQSEAKGVLSWWACDARGWHWRWDVCAPWRWGSGRGMVSSVMIFQESFKSHGWNDRETEALCGQVQRLPRLQHGPGGAVIVPYNGGGKMSAKNSSHLFGGFLKWWYPKMDGENNGKTPLKWMIWGGGYHQPPSFHRGEKLLLQEPLSHLHPGSCFGGLAVLNITRLLAKHACSHACSCG